MVNSNKSISDICVFNYRNTSIDTAERVDEWREIVKNAIETLSNEEQIECGLKHRFSPGLYLREIIMPKGSFVIGKIHATEHFNIILSGECLVATVDGIEHIKGPCTFISKAGIQKCVFNITDVVWQTTHVTEKTNLEEIEKDVIAEDYNQLQVDFILNKINGG